MEHSSQKLILDSRLLAIEELLKQRQFTVAGQEIDQIDLSELVEGQPNIGLFYSIKAETLLFAGSYRNALDYGLKSSKVLAKYSFNSRYARALLIVSKAYYAMGDMKNAEIRSRDSLATYRRAGDIHGQVAALNRIARVAYTRCNYEAAANLIDEAIGLATNDPVQVARLSGNAGAIRVFTGDWDKAESDLNKAIEFHRENKLEISLSVNLLSLGALHLRRREFVFTGRCLSEAKEIIDRLDLKREKIIHLEIAGELALEKGDYTRSKHILSEAVHLGRLIAPGSALISQSERLLAEVELALENTDQAMRCAQKALEVATQIGEQTEVGLAKRIVARVFAARSEFSDAEEYIQSAIDQLRQVGDPASLAKTLLTNAEILMASDSSENDIVRRSLEEASSLYNELNLDFWSAESAYLEGVFNCRQGNLSKGFRHLTKAEKLFAAVGDIGKVKHVKLFLTSLSDQAVALSISQENQFKVFGNLLSQDEMSGLKAGAMDEVLGVLLKRTNADRAVIFSPDFEHLTMVSSLSMTTEQTRRFAQSLNQMLGEEISRSKPTLMLDCRRDPYISSLFPDRPEMITSLAVIPFRLSDNSTSFVCIFKLSPDGNMNPFCQDELNFAVGFSELIAFKAAEIQKMMLLEDNRRLKAQLLKEAAFPNIITRNKKMLEMLAQVRQVVDSNISISIEGETGSGKDLLAKATHYNSMRRDKRFISVNCAALPETLLESELFGYRRGAFTGADRDKPGLMEEADGGTFFLDEIADMPLSVQAKILRVLEGQEIVRLGETTPRKIDVRIVSATNKNLKEEIAAKTFRQDLYYRLTALTFRIPALRERREDIPLLVDHFLEGTGKVVNPETLKLLLAYNWPGNIRELDNEIKKLILLTGDNKEIRSELLSSRIKSNTSSDNQSVVGNSHSVDEIKFNEHYSLYDYLSGYEKHFIVRALKEHKGIKKHAAASLNIPESTLRLKIKQYDIDNNLRDSIN